MARLISCSLLFFALLSPVSASALPFNFYTSLAGKLGYGTAFSSDKSAVPARTLLVPAVEGVAAIRGSFFLLGFTAEYAWWQQLKKPSGLSNSNLQGTMLTLVPTFGVGSTNFRILARYFPLFSKYDLAKPNREGEKQSYRSADQLGLQLLFRMAGRSFLGVEYATTKFSKREANGKEYSLAAGSEAEFTNIGVTYVVRF